MFFQIAFASLIKNLIFLYQMKGHTQNTEIQNTDHCF
jgi:hypothetical protein